MTREIQLYIRNIIVGSNPSVGSTRFTFYIAGVGVDVSVGSLVTGGTGVAVTS